MKITRIVYAVTAAGALVMAEILSSGQPLNLAYEAEAVLDAEPEEEALTSPANRFPARFPKEDFGLAPEEHSHQEETTETETEMSAVSQSLISKGARGITLYTLTLKAVIPTLNPTPERTMLLVEKVGQPIASETAALFYGHESDLQRLESDLQAVLHLPEKQVKGIMAQLRSRGEITIANEVADDSSVIARFPPAKEKTNFSLAIVPQAYGLSENALDPVTEFTPEDQSGRPLLSNAFSYFDHPVKWLRHFTSLELERFGMNAGIAFPFVTPSPFKF
jgi:hypothetical protein